MSDGINPNINRRGMMDREMNRVIPRSRRDLYGGVVVRPKRAAFGTQNKGEKIFVLIRQHWIVNFGWIFRTSVYLVLPIFLYIVLPFFVEIIGITISGVPARIWAVILLGYYSVILTSAFMNFVDWYYDIFIVTNERIIDLEFSPTIGYKIVEAALVNIQDVKEESREFWGTIFNFGDLKAKTSSDRGVLMLERIPNPTQVRDIVSDLVGIAKKYS